MTHDGQNYRVLRYYMGLPYAFIELEPIDRIGEPKKVLIDRLHEIKVTE